MNSINFVYDQCHWVFMSNLLKYIIIAIAALVLIVVGYFGNQLYTKIKNPIAPAISAVPASSAFFIEMNNLKKGFNKLGNQDFWKELQHIPSFRKFSSDIAKLDSILTKYQGAEDILHKEKMIISFLHLDSLGFEPVFIVVLPQSVTALSVESFIKKENGAKSITIQKSYGEAKINRVNISSLNHLFCYTVYKGLLIGAFNEMALNSAIDQLDSGTPVNSEQDFQQIERTAGKKVDANIYLNYQQFGKIAQSLINPDFQDFIGDLIQFGYWTETDLIIKQDELLLNGYTVASDSGGQLLNCFKQQPQEIRIPEILPSDIAWMLHFGFNDFSEYESSRQLYLKLVSDNSDNVTTISSLKSELNIDSESHFYSWIGNEIALVETSDNDQLIIIHAQNVKTATDRLNEIAVKSAKKTGQKLYNKDYNEYSIGRISIPDFTGNLLGPVFRNISNPFYVVIKDYIVFSNQPQPLVHLIDAFYQQNTFNRDYNYQSFSDNISDKSNIYFYCNIRKSLESIPSFFNSAISDGIILNEKSIRNFEGLALQFSFINNMFYTNIYVKYNPDYQEEEISGWETMLEANLVGEPMIVRNHKTGRLNIVVFDQLNNICLINHNGKILFNNQIIEEPKSKIFQVDYYKNGDVQYLFNSENYLHLIDLQGNYIENFPIKLPVSATGPMVVFDYDNSKEYRLLIPLIDNMIYNFSVKGEIIEGWNKVKTQVVVSSSVEHLVTAGKDYIFITDEKGNMSITNRRGEGRIKIKKSFERAPHSRIYLNETNSKKGLFLTTDRKGNLVYISQKGKVSKTGFGDFSDQHFFLYEDFTNNGAKDFIFLDDQKLVVLDKFKKIILEYNFDEAIMYPPVFFTKRNGDAFLGIVSQGAQEVLIINKNGQVEIGKKLQGNTPFRVCSLNNDNEMNILVGMENILYNYLLEN